MQIPSSKGLIQLVSRWLDNPWNLQSFSISPPPDQEENKSPLSRAKYELHFYKILYIPKYLHELEQFTMINDIKTSH